MGASAAPPGRVRTGREAEHGRRLSLGRQTATLLLSAAFRLPISVAHPNTAGKVSSLCLPNLR